MGEKWWWTWTHLEICMRSHSIWSTCYTRYSRISPYHTLLFWITLDKRMQILYKIYIHICKWFKWLQMIHQKTQSPGLSVKQLSDQINCFGKTIGCLNTFEPECGNLTDRDTSPEPTLWWPRSLFSQLLPGTRLRSHCGRETWGWDMFGYRQGRNPQLNYQNPPKIIGSVEVLGFRVSIHLG